MSGDRFSYLKGSGLLDIDEVALIFGLSRESIYHRRAKGDFAPAIRVGGRLRWDPDDLKVWLEARRDQGTSP